MIVNIECPEGRGPGKILVEIHEWDVWSMSDTLAHIILPLLRCHRQAERGHPAHIGPGVWQEILDKMEFSFEEIATGRYDSTYHDNYQDRIQEGLCLFGKHYLSLWT